MRWTRQCRVRFSGSRGDFIVSDSEAHETSGNVAYGEVVWSWHPLLVSSRAEALVGPTGCATPFNPRGDGDKKELVAGESTKEAVKTIAQGRPDDRPHLWFLPLCFLIAQGAMGASWHPAFPAPSHLAQRNFMQKLGRVARRGRGIVSGPVRCGRRG